MKISIVSGDLGRAAVWKEVETAHGIYRIEVSEKGLRSLYFPGRQKEPEAVPKLPQVHASAERLVKKISCKLKKYFEGGLVDFSGVPLDLDGYTAYERAVLNALARSERGKLHSYASLAEAAGYPGSARAVGQVMNKNRIPVIIPCHRVLRSDGSLGGFGCGVDLKIRLLLLEKAISPEGLLLLPIRGSVLKKHGMTSLIPALAARSAML